MPSFTVLPSSADASLQELHSELFISSRWKGRRSGRSFRKRKTMHASALPSSLTARSRGGSRSKMTIEAKTEINLDEESRCPVHI